MFAAFMWFSYSATLIPGCVRKTKRARIGGQRRFFWHSSRDLVVIVASLLSPSRKEVSKWGMGAL